MKRSSVKEFIENLLHAANIDINGNHPWDVRVHNEELYARVLANKELGVGESYMEGWWDCDRLDLMFEKIFTAHLDEKIKNNFWVLLKLSLLKVFNPQTGKRVYEVGEKHYDLGNQLFQTMLDNRMNYSCAYWPQAKTLDEAQLAKLDLICRKLYLKPGMKLLDIGCGWGSLAKFAAENYGVKVVGVTIAKEQYDYARESCAHLPVEIRLMDYRELHEKFDCIASVGMFEHVGFLNYPMYMAVVHRCLQEEGLFLLHCIGANESLVATNPWFDKYIFPHGALPSIAQIGKASEKLLVMEDWHNFGIDYDKTLMAWHANFNANRDKLNQQYDQRFCRMWNFYLLSSAASFRSRVLQLWQIVFSKTGIKTGYIALR